MDAGTILRLGAAMLAFGSLGLFLVRWSNQRLRGLGWLGAAFFSGFLGAFFLTAPGVGRILRVAGSDFFVLLGFVLLQVAAVELMTQRNQWPQLGLFLLALVLFVDTISLVTHLDHIRLIAVSLLVAAQCARTGWLLWVTARRLERGPALFCASVLAAFTAFNILRATVVAAGYLYAWHWNDIVNTLSYALYIAVALGLAFGFFWMSTAQLSQQLEQMAGTDPLTRLYNRRTFLNACERELASAQQQQTPFSILMIDLDHFKSVNDRFGHAAGDAALMAAVYSMQDSIRGSDVLARWGGEEFTALLPNADHEAAHIVAERLRANVERIQLPIEVDGPAGPAIITMTVSIGVATCDAADSIQTLMSRADQNLYLAKGSGRNCVLAVPSARMVSALVH